MKIQLPPHDTENDNSLIENFFDAMWTYHDDQVLELRKELPDIQCPEIEIYCALRYEGEVKNGGHNQYINNLDGNQIEFAIALDGLRLIEADKQAEILDKMIGWTKAEPGEVHRMLNTYSHVEQPVLELLNDEFFLVQKTRSVRQQAANWLRANGDFEYVTPEEFVAVKQNLHGAHSPNGNSKKQSGQGGLLVRLAGFFGKSH